MSWSILICALDVFLGTLEIWLCRIVISTCRRSASGATCTSHSPDALLSLSHPSVDRDAILLGKLNAIQTMSTTIPFVIEHVFTLPVVIFNHPRYNNAARSLADKSVLHVYKAVFYNIPVQVKPRQEVFCVTCGAFIGLVAGWENALNCVLGVPGTVHFRVDSITSGEEFFRNAIDQGSIEMVEPWATPDLLRTDKFINFLFFVLGHNSDINFSFFILGGAHNGDLWDELAATGSNGGTLSCLQLPRGRHRWEFYEDSESAQIR
ncbi:hypothetical protein EV702DRAFT_1202632 [Suillus placidus]|uniref:Uncharacterized protein n=1 Tax=Suillus placidus TaxID=48579 RepID=A0A9P7CY74_9AGAM|nr:hypothetical protein EV702DRAFT_1202632 [Suillus placidus]